jgi:hypothetical protein
MASQAIMNPETQHATATPNLTAPVINSRKENQLELQGLEKTSESEMPSLFITIQSQNSCDVYVHHI